MYHFVSYLVPIEAITSLDMAKTYCNVTGLVLDMYSIWGVPAHVLKDASCSRLEFLTKGDRDSAQEFVDNARILEPFAGPQMGEAALCVGMALDVVQSYVDCLPPPPTAPVRPPFMLYEALMQ